MSYLNTTPSPDCRGARERRAAATACVNSGVWAARAHPITRELRRLLEEQAEVCGAHKPAWSSGARAEFPASDIPASRAALEPRSRKHKPVKSRRHVQASAWRRRRTLGRPAGNPRRAPAPRPARRSASRGLCVCSCYTRANARSEAPQAGGQGDRARRATRAQQVVAAEREGPRIRHSGPATRGDGADTTR